jgi:diguanylate cyclase (GGDEF)-like protein
MTAGHGRRRDDPDGDDGLPQDSTRRWALWQLPTRTVVGYIVAVDLAALAGAVAAFAVVPVPGGDLFPFVALMLCSVLYTELSRPIERVREAYKGAPYIALNSVWIFASVILLHPGLAAVLIASTFYYRWLRVQPNPLYRRTFSTAATILSGYAAAAFLTVTGHGSFGEMHRDVPAFAVIVATGAVFFVVNTVLMTVAVYYGTPHTRIRDALATPGDYALELATIGLGILLGWALADWPIALLLIIGITLVLHRGVLIRQLRDQARLDAKTGLLNADSWGKAAADELDRATGAGHDTGVLMIDLDHFKAINDRYGHPTGDRLLRVIADALKDEVRSSDLVGRYGGEEFVVLLARTTRLHGRAIAERIRHRIATTNPDGVNPADLGRVTVSIGVAVHPEDGDTVDDMIASADRALYAAKRAGRDQIAVYGEAPPPVPVHEA